MLAGVERCEAVPGRFERVDEGQPFTVVVDYAHTDDALRNVIRAARELSPKRVITLFGCAKVAELADAPDLGSGTERCGGSSPPFRISDEIASYERPATSRLRKAKN